MISRIMLRGSAALGALALASAPAYAGTGETLLKRLHEKGILSDDEYAELLAEEQTEASAAPAAPVAQAGKSLDTSRLVKMTDSGIGLEVGPATIKFSGSVNGFYVHDNPDTPSATTSVIGGIASVGTKNSSAVRNGLLPGYLTVAVSTQQEGWDIGAFFGLYPGINSAAWGTLGANNGGQPTALATAGIDARQTYMTFGKPRLGTIKIGRDIGLFGSEAILNDITLLSSGTPGNNVAPANTTLGRIGVGYIYTDFQPQITYSSPNLSGFQGSVGVFQPLDSLTGPAQTNASPGFQGKLTYDGKIGGIGARLWVSGVSQKHDMVTGGSYTGRGIDFGGKVTAGPIAVTGYYYTAKGLGTTVLGLLDTDDFGNPRKSDGFYVQALATFGKIAVGGSYGESSLHYANAADAIAVPDLLKTNSSYVGQLRYNLTSWVTLIGEYVHSKAEAHSGNEAQSDAMALGGILFF
ncbi:porin [Novosphingobium mangrovi (ex Huang et al. 2023)]|uniref:Porin n=1 Tax=Novosphingobium mangrovi (ex Huang et al. 2023) TaxID=2976432 RepID=A0ABT2I1S2_9SPHN|nr:porin [Novosphingobium mangrovi (ex Huang et al. 2023)]MCT2398762.1 porin [Novosphingobium mangrovi (ex Huang et al. 2023)]